MGAEYPGACIALRSNAGLATNARGAWSEERRISDSVTLPMCHIELDGRSEALDQDILSTWFMMDKSW